MLAQVEEVSLDQTARVAGDEHLPAVACRGNACAFVHVVPDVALPAQVRCARMDADTDLDRALRQALEPLPGGRDRIRGRRKRDEERVSLGVDLNASVAGERRAQDPPMLLESVGIGRRPEIVQQRGRALDIREEERDCSGRKLGAHDGRDHAPESAPSPGP